MSKNLLISLALADLQLVISRSTRSHESSHKQADHSPSPLSRITRVTTVPARVAHVKENWFSIILTLRCKAPVAHILAAIDTWDHYVLLNYFFFNIS